jgi:hypothetical protein
VRNVIAGRSGIMAQMPQARSGVRAYLPREVGDVR